MSLFTFTPPFDIFIILYRYQSVKVCLFNRQGTERQAKARTCRCEREHFRIS